MVRLGGAGLVDGEYPVGAADAVDGHLGDGEHLGDEALDQCLSVARVVVVVDGMDAVVLALVADAVHRVEDREYANPDSDRGCEAMRAELDFAMEVPSDWEPVAVALDCFAARGRPSFNEAIIGIVFQQLQSNELPNFLFNNPHKQKQLFSLRQNGDSYCARYTTATHTNIHTESVAFLHIIGLENVSIHSQCIPNWIAIDSRHFGGLQLAFLTGKLG